MGIIHEWFCAEHGEFEATHAICPALGCRSREVVKEIRTPRAVGTGLAKRTDAGLRRTAEAYGQSDFKSAKEGESSKANNQAAQVLWGDEATKVLGRPLTQAFAPSQFNITDQATGKRGVWTDFGGVPTVANESHLLDNVTPKAVETIVSQNEKQMRKQLND
jgi:hypothetical protein